jgi:hypothetical protein
MEHQLAEYSAWMTQIEDCRPEILQSEYWYPEEIEEEFNHGLLACSDPPAYDVSKNIIVNPRQVLILILKSYYYVSDDFIDRIAPRIDMDKEILTALIDQLRERRLQHDDYIRNLQENAYSQFYRCLICERRISEESAGSRRRIRLEKSLCVAKIRLASLRKRLSRTRFEATNLQVAELLGVPKGTIDSNLSTLRTRMRHIAPLDKISLN